MSSIIYWSKMAHLATHKWLTLLLVLVHFLIMFSASHSNTDRDALLCLKSQLSDPSGALASWGNESSFFCNWQGVTCSRQNASQVISLYLESLNLAGQIFPCIALLSFLSRIHMPCNQLNGHISADIGLLTRLRYLNLSMNSLNGVIPNAISLCSRLEVIDLQSNSLEGEIPQSLAQCSSLQQIILTNNNLQGSIPSQSALLPNLSVILLSSNKLTGIIPELLGSSKSLTQVNLKNNSISGEIPHGLFNSTTLSYIDLSRNHLSGSIPTFLKTSIPLQYLSLTENNLTGEIPVSVGNISFLSSLLLTQNNLQGSIPDCLSKIANFRVLNLKNNNLSGTVPPSLFNISSLTYLSLSNNQLVGTIPANIGITLPKITELIIGGNRIEGHIPSSLANSSDLKNLDIRSNSFTGPIPSLGFLSKLKILDLGTNRFQAGDWTFFSSLTNCTQLQMLCLDFNGFEGKIPSSIGSLSQTLNVLLLTDNQLTGHIPSEIGNLTNLTVLIMDNNELMGHIPDTLGNLQNLSLLSLSKNKLFGEIPQSMGKLEWLTELHLSENGLTGRIPASLAGCKNLIQLNLSSNSFYGSIPQDLFSISTLSKGLDLSHNQLTGNIPMEIGKLINLNSVSISNNQLTGEIPFALGDCLLLESLHLQANFLGGSIPRSLINLRGIIEMDLSQNNLFGEIPQFFGSFSYLKILNLSFNDLNGEVPNRGIFENSSAVFIEGNNKLCASSSMLQLPLCVESSSKRQKLPYILAILVPITAIVLITLACVMVILFKKRYKATQPTNQSLKQFKSFSYHDLFKATDGFSSANIIGSGRFGFVYRGYIESDVCTVAIKVFRLDQFGAANNFVAECEALRNIRHRNLIRVVSLCSTFDPAGNEFKALVLEHMANGNLETWLHPKLYIQTPKEPLSLASRILIAVDIAAALEYLHNRCTPPLVHSDLKPSNVLLDDEMVAHVSDFGLAKFLYSDSMTSTTSYSIAGPRGSIGYIAPEYAMGCKISFEGDIYSYGIILLELITGKYPTDEMFTDGMNLHQMVESAIPHKIGEILEPSLTKDYLGEDTNHELVEMPRCVMQLAKLGLRCSVTSPKDRPKIKDVYTEIIAIQNMFSALHN